MMWMNEYDVTVLFSLSLFSFASFSLLYSVSCFSIITKPCRVMSGHVGLRSPVWFLVAFVLLSGVFGMLRGRLGAGRV